jgi:hypothetical protein
MLVIQVLLGLIPLLGIVWILVSGTLATVDGLFTSLILLTISGVLMLNPMLHMRTRMLKLREERKKSTAAALQKTESAKSTPAAQVQKTSDSPQPQKTTS